ncbi:MAG TPA: GNAT family N-acetyltransferase [Anaerolineae bacterium]
MDIREATHDDLDLLAELNLEVQDLHVAAEPGIFRPARHADARAAFEQLLAWADTSVYIGFEGDEAVGYLVAVIQVRPANGFTHERRVLYIDQIGVRRTAQHRGYGAALIEAACQLAGSHHLDRVELDTWDFNKNAQAFFASQGFRPLRIRLARDLR